MANLLEIVEPGLTNRLPSKVESDNASAAEALCAETIVSNQPVTLTVGGESLQLEPAIVKMLVLMLGYVAKENLVKVIPVAKMLTTQQAADILNVSRPHFVKILEEGQIPFEMVGKHRRVRLQNLLTFQEQRQTVQEQLMTELVALGQEFDEA